MSVNHYDVAIVGGGMSGACLALALSRLPLRVALLEAALPDVAQHPAFDARAIALSAGSVDALSRHGIWPLLAPQAEPITRIHVSDAGHLGQVRLAASDYRLPALGQVIELTAAGRALQQALAMARNVEFYCPVTPMTLQPDVSGVTLTLSDGRALSTRLLVAADGGHSFVREALKIPVTRHDFEQSALIATVKTAEHPQGRAFERFTKGGPLALLPLPGGLSSLVWSVPRHEAPELAALPDAAFLARLQQAFGWRLGRFEQTGPRHLYPLVMTQAPWPIGQRTVLLGNAAHLLHPIAGQGFNLGMRDIDQLVLTLEEGLSRGEQPGDHEMLRRYWERRRQDQQDTIWLTSALAELFSNDYAPLVVGRNLGLSLMGHLPLLQRPLVAQTLGFGVAPSAR
ncbi:2-octaprenyl-6-methoxyphenyl hydroxylase [Aeromonas diversa]|uniref:2-polyprenyl-6-methoxyphenol 4-hydroxylase n=1 Tax=Aeromonas diversa CDC 2478-85 TaxID=1268237 RepID=N9U352_9GAMM|nr:2-octaprenyl-6-methoxyphenyl hydroxylase [Aeromonas diversa]ENY72809.1 2-polyprenyl-6-methoxyphenol 4-hydroxylase [Aeromonas diversa CDC 2478-85]